ncbi:hypothetical protein BOTBODRAFT_145159 [Botryobasidium botryosum FD-172 SS1]|uniref:DH domain-containing protein n=1 Tax=Botryobasidium botryosum (strain FD-172 SS1) TaxID=930990 RepID=A0A067MV37_BOTB1|nr:hypothetical protein BOTBODRAFT_145159 [Botryobasidium botryosum FD-172 SS1]
MLQSSPRKTVPLNDQDSQSSGGSTSITKRAFYCDVVVEGPASGKPLSQEVQDLITSLGEHISPDGTKTRLASASSGAALSDPAESDTPAGLSSKADESVLADVINELVTTERSYVRRLRMLKQEYADPLRSFARQKETAIIPAYEAKTLFGNIDHILPVNELFLVDLEKMAGPNGAKLVGGVGDVALKHFRDLRGFECYKQYYIKRDEAQAIFEREVMRRSNGGFAEFIDRIKYSTAEARGRVGLRELLMDPVQRIPRYTLLFRMMIKYMAYDDPQRARLIEAEAIASKIALCETDEETRRAAVMYCLQGSVDGFPPALISNSRRFIDCIDVDDLPVDMVPPASNSAAASAEILHCSLFLFDDRLMIVKRQSPTASARSLAGLDDIDKVTKSGGLLGLSKAPGLRRDGMSCKGVVDVTDVVCTDVGGPESPEFHFYLEQPPQDQTDKWSNRPFRSLCAVVPPAPSHFESPKSTAAKQRFLENLWNAQALYRTKQGRSLALASEEIEVGSSSSSGRKTNIARTYFNVYQRTAYLGEPKKGKIILHIDQLGTADPLPFGVDCGPYAIVRAQPMPGDLCRYTVTSNDPSDVPEEDIVQTSTVHKRIIQTIHQFGLFKFRTGRNSAPSTPSTNRTRAAIFGLDVISRNLFNARPGGPKGDVFGSMNSHRRSRSAASQVSSRSTTLTNSTYKSTYRSNSTVATSIMMDEFEDDSVILSHRGSPGKQKRHRSPGAYLGESDGSRPGTPRDEDMLTAHGVDESEWDLSMRLELAKQNSRNQRGPDLASMKKDDLPPLPPGAPSPEPQTSKPQLAPLVIESTTSPKDTSRPRGVFAERRQPLGPRTPLPSPNPPDADSAEPMNDIVDFYSRSETPTTPTMSDRPQETTPPPSSPRTAEPSARAVATDLSTVTTPRRTDSFAVIEPLSIKKKASVRKPSVAIKTKTFGSPSRVSGARRVSAQARQERKSGAAAAAAAKQSVNELSERVVYAAESARSDVQSSRRAVKRIKLEVDAMKSAITQDEGASELLHPKLGISGRPTQIPYSRYNASKAAEARLQEMQRLIEQGRGQGVRRTPVVSSVLGATEGSSMEEWTKRLEELVTETDQGLKRATTHQDSLHNDLKQLTFDFKEKLAELDKAQSELQRAKRQCDLVKQLLSDATAENEILYDAFNEELDGMFNDVNLPPEEAWTALIADLREAKEAKNALAKENAKLRRNLEQAELQKEEWGALLRAHNLIP